MSYFIGVLIDKIIFDDIGICYIEEYRGTEVLLNRVTEEDFVGYLMADNVFCNEWYFRNRHVNNLREISEEKWSKIVESRRKE
jgi:hypothetical protein